MQIKLPGMASGGIIFYPPSKILFVMKLTTILIMAAVMQVSAKSTAQTVTLSAKSVPLQEVFSVIRKQTGYVFFYDKGELTGTNPVSVDLKDVPLQDALNKVLSGQPLSYDIQGNTIFIVKVEKAPLVDKPVMDLPPPVQIKGRVVDDSSGAPITDVSVIVKGTKVGVNTNREGEFSFSYNGTGKIVLLVSHVGYAEKQIEVQQGVYVTIRLNMADQKLANVEISTGMFKRKEERFSGATATYSGEDLRRVGNQNIIQSLKALDPSFIVIENNAKGSNPTSLPTIELRGKSSITTTQLNDQFALDPNQPLFVLNGFETTLDKIVNLDINRVASITILKDAASTAIYGSRAANGVIVVETLEPVPGKLRLQYTAGSNVNIPDLRSYNMMNASEKLEFERLAGLYEPRYSLGYELQELYNRRLAEVKRGVNTYWLSIPVRTAISDNHDLYVQGGNEEFTYGIQGTVRTERGVMKGSENKTWGGSIDLTYRHEKINISNSLYIDGKNSSESPYGSFSTFVAANPYYRKSDGSGAIPVNLDTVLVPGLYTTSYTYVANPLYDASLNNINKTKGLALQNSLRANLDILSYLRLTGSLQLKTSSNTQVIFTPPENTAFQTTSYLLKGTYSSTTTELHGYDFNIGLNFHRTVGAHSITSDVRGRLAEDVNRSNGYSATGFPYGTNGNPSYAYSYTPNAVPSSASLIKRNTSLISNLNYGFDRRYFFDATYSLDGSSNFGSNRIFKPFWSVGAGWNIHQEAWFNVPWLSVLRLKANRGVAGNQALGQSTSNSIYQYITSSNIFGQSLQRSSLGNPNLAWQTTSMNSFEGSFSLWHGRLDGRANYYVHLTDPMLINITEIFPSSVGISSSYPVNLGKLTTKGWEGTLTIVPFVKADKGMKWTLSINGTFGTRSVYGNFGSSLDALNKEQVSSNGLIRYRDGYSPDDIWAVVSRGIDPATGKEIFQKADGTETFVYNTDDIVRVGNSRPKVKGSIANSFTYKKFSVYINAGYTLGAYTFNSTLYNKVENISESELTKNQDRRALYGRWKKPGDIAQFRGIQLAADGITPITSRFIQKDNHIEFSSISFFWRTDSPAWLKGANVSSFSVSVQLNDVLRYGSILYERGTEYPFQRTGTITLNLFF